MYAGIFLLSVLLTSVNGKECVSTLSSSNFTELVEPSSSSWLVMFIDSQCSHCKEVFPFWYETVDKLCNNPSLRFGIVELETERDLRYQFEVGTTLAIKLIKNRRVYSFNSSYPVQTLEDFALRASALSDGESLPQPKNSLSKLWYIVKTTMSELFPMFDKVNLGGLSDLTKIIILILLLLSSLIMAAILIKLLGKADKKGEEEEEIRSDVLETMNKEKAPKGR